MTSVALRALPTPRRTPLTWGYLVVLLASTVLLRQLDSDRAEALLADLSTDAAHLTHVPLRVLLGSALLLPDAVWLPYAVVLAAALGALERRSGWRRTALVFLSGHVLATLLTEVPIAIAVWQQWLPSSAAHRLDVGVSYGMYAAIGAALVLLPPTARRLGVAVVAATVLVPLILDHDLTSSGHVLSLAIGVAWWPSISRSQAPAQLRPGAGEARVERQQVDTRESHPADVGALLVERVDGELLCR